MSRISPRRHRGALIERLEVRQLMAFTANVNFQPRNTPVPVGYFADTGAVYALRPNGLTYGWNANNSGTTRDRGVASDQRYDTLIHMQKPSLPNAVWEIAVPNGNYQVHIVCGDPTAADGVYRINAESTLVLSGTPTSAKRWVESTATVIVSDGKLTISNGAGGSNNKLGFIDITSIDTNPNPNPTLSWSNLPTVPLGRSEALGASAGGKFYLFGGYTNTKTIVPSSKVDCYDPATNQWTAKSDLPEGLTHSGVAVDGRYIYIAGGYPPNASHTFQIYATTAVRRYDTVTDTYASIRGLPQARGAGNLVLLGRDLHFFSGADINRVDRNEHWSLNLDDAAANWIVRAPIPTDRNHLGAAVLGGKIYAIGGAQEQDAEETALATVEIYDPATNQWTAGPSLPTPRALIMSAVVVRAGRIIVAGGETKFNAATTQVTSFDPATGKWTQLKPLPSPRISGVLGVLGDDLIFATGYYYNAPPNGFSNTAWRGVFT